MSIFLVIVTIKLLNISLVETSYSIIVTLMLHAYRQAQPDTDCNSNGFVVEPQAAGGYRQAKSQSPLCVEEAAKKETCRRGEFIWDSTYARPASTQDGPQTVV